MALWKNHDETLLQGLPNPLYCPIYFSKDHLVNYLYFSEFAEEKDIPHWHVLQTREMKKYTFFLLRCKEL